MAFMRQVELYHPDTHVETVCWVDAVENLCKGNFLTLKDDKRIWSICKVHDTIIEKKEINRTWHVGGL